MGVYSGKCDLQDHIAGQGGWFDKEGNSVEFGDPNVHCYYSDELKDFEAFKKATNGILHQHHKINVNIYNQQFVKEHCKQFDFKEVAKNKYVYTYWNKEYTLKELNKHGVYVETEIHFNTLLDLIPYYPYLVTVAACDESGEYVVISNESYVDSQFKKHLQSGWISELDYKQKLQEHYLDVCQKYFLYKLEERTVEIPIFTYKPLHNGYYEILLDEPADYMHKPEFVWADNKLHSHWSSPILENSGTLLISEQDIEYYLADDIKQNNVKIKYVKKCEFDLWIN